MHLIIYIGIILFSTSCENEIPYTPAHSEPQLIMNALLDACLLYTSDAADE